MSEFETVEVPFVQIGNRRGLTREQVEDNPWLLDFVRAFPASFEPAIDQDALLYIEPVPHPVNDSGEEK